MSKINDLTRVLTELRGGLVALNAAQQMDFDNTSNND